jgi:hypothetical protein
MQCCDSTMDTLDIHHWEPPTGGCVGVADPKGLYVYTLWRTHRAGGQDGLLP